MRISIVLAILLIGLLTSSCRKENRFAGKYAISVYSIYDKSTNDTLTLDFKDKSAFAMLRDYTPSSWSAHPDETYFEMQQSCYLELRDDSTFFLRDLGFIVPNNLFMLQEREMNGRWKFEKNGQYLTLKALPEINKRFKIEKLSKDGLYLRNIIANLDIAFKLTKR